MRKNIRKLILILALVLILFSAYSLWKIDREYSQAEELYDGYVENYSKKNPNDKEIDEERKPISIDFEALLLNNKDIVGWIYSEDTPINYPVVQASDNDYYLRRMLDRNYNINGTIFMDYRNEEDLSDYNTIIYGHNMKNGAMFGSLPNYMEAGYYKEHPTIYYLTAERNYKIEVLSAYVTDSRSDSYSIQTDPQEQSELGQTMLLQSVFPTYKTIEEGDKLITLSTCAYDFEEARYVVIGKLKAID